MASTVGNTTNPVKSAHFSHILGHLRNYWLINRRILAKGIPIRELLVLKYPLRMTDATRPPLLSVDFTDACNLECRYCNNPHFPKPRTMMSDETFDCLLQQIAASGVNRVRVGGGEPTLHPRCGEFLRRLSARVKFLSIVTNAQWQSPRIAEDLIASAIDLVEISVDAGGAEVYESSRTHADYHKLLEHLKLLRSLRDRYHSRTVIKVRLMLRPSTKSSEAAETQFLRQFCDCVLPQYVMQHPDTDYSEDVFVQESTAAERVPLCLVPFRDMQVRPDGRIPVCAARGSVLDDKEKLFIGNIRSDNLLDLWNGRTMSALRNAHRSRKGDILDGCRGCHYG